MTVDCSRFQSFRVIGPRIQHSVDDALAIAVGLKAPREPHAGVREDAVVEVHRILRGDQDAHAERARLLEQRDEGLLGRRVGGVGRREPEDLVEHEKCAERGRTRLRTDPSQKLIEDDPKNEGALVVIEMGHADNHRRRAPVRPGREPRAHVERRPLPP
jgi:hypothetical protein